MSIPSCWQQSATAKFLAVSRQHFALCRRRQTPWNRLRRLLVSVFRMLLITGSMGGVLGHQSYADSVSEHNEASTEQIVSSTAPGVKDEADSRSVIEKMP